jgi:hypothetical protein
MVYCVSWHSPLLCCAFRRDMYFVDGVLVACVPVANVCGLPDCLI